MPDGTFFDKGTVDNYMNSLVKEAYEKNGNVTNEELEMLDKKVCKWATNMFTAFCRC